MHPNELIHQLKRRAPIYEAMFNGQTGPAWGLFTVDDVTVTQIPDGYEAIFWKEQKTILGYVIQAKGDRMTIATIDPETRARLGTIVHYVRTGS